MAEYVIQGETLTGIAEKIRPLLGLTGTMTPEQMQTNLTTEQANITAALAALAEKGVEVPAGANSNALAGLIGAIEAGGVKLEAGSVTLANDMQSYTFLSVDSDVPDIFILWSESEGKPTHTSRNTIWVNIRYKEDRKNIVFGYNIGTRKYYAPYTGRFVDTNHIGTISNNDFNTKLLASASPYKWIAIWGV